MDQSIIKLFKGAECTWHGRDPKYCQVFKIGMGGNINIEQTYEYHKNYKENKLLRIVSIDLTGSKLGELLKEFDKTK